MSKFIRILLIVSFLFSVTKVVADEDNFSAQATFSPLVNKSLLLASDQQAGLKIIVGERGHILYSPDSKRWMQAQVETKTTLTNVFMLDDKVAWAVGHDAVILKTNDSAKTWQNIFSDINASAPLLDIYFKDVFNGIVIGAYGLMYTTSDGGNNWYKKELNISNRSTIESEDATPELTEIYDLHLNAIADAGNDRLYIAAEAGHILRSDDDGKSWQDLPSPYRGSFFGLLPLSFNELIVYGLRGHLYLTSDAGESWEKIETHSEEMLTDAKRLTNGDIVVTGLGGTLLLSKDNAQTFTVINLDNRHGLSSVLETEDGELVLVGDAGFQVLPFAQF